jgi:hypothetical protein
LSIPSNNIDASPSSFHLDIGAGVASSGTCPKNWYESGEKLFLPRGIHTEVAIKLPEPAKRYVPVLHVLITAAVAEITPASQYVRDS